MAKFLVMLAATFVSLAAFAAEHSTAECEILDALNVVDEFQCKRSEGSVYHSNGQYAGSRGGSWYHDNGQYAGSAGGSWYHENGQYAGAIGGSWYHENGQYAGSAGGSWYYANGQYAGSNGGSWYTTEGKYVGTYSNLTEIEQLLVVMYEKFD